MLDWFRVISVVDYLLYAFVVSFHLYKNSLLDIFTRLLYKTSCIIFLIYSYIWQQCCSYAFFLNTGFHISLNVSSPVPSIVVRHSTGGPANQNFPSTKWNVSTSGFEPRSPRVSNINKQHAPLQARTLTCDDCYFVCYSEGRSLFRALLFNAISVGPNC